MDMFEHAEGKRRATEGIQLAMDNNTYWKIDAIHQLEKIWRERKHETNEFTFEMLKFPVVKACGQPYSSAVWGGLAREMVKHGWIVCSGTANAQNAAANSSLRRKYRWVG